MNIVQRSRPLHRWATLSFCGLALIAGVAGAAPLPPIGPVWAQRYELPDKRNLAYDLIVDAAGNSYSIYRSGEEGDARVGVAKYSTTGQLLWVSGFDGDGSIEEDIWAKADSNGNLVVIGTLLGGGDDTNIIVAKIAPDGTLLWDVTYEGAGGPIDDAGDVAVDAAGDIYVAGDTLNAVDDSSDALLVKLSGVDGSPLWRATLPGEEDTNQYGYDVVADASGGVYLAGSNELEEDHFGLLAAKFDAANGAPVWDSTYSGPNDDDGYALWIGLSGTGVVIAGSARGNEGYDFVTVKFNASDGQQVWVGRYDGPRTGEESVDDLSALAIDSSGNAIVTGASVGTGTAAADFATVKFNATTGAQMWVARYNGPGTEDLDEDFPVYDFPNDVRTDGAGNVYVTGTVVVSNFRTDIGTLKYNAAGQQQWVHLYNPRGLDDGAAALGLDASGNVYLNGTATVRENEFDTNDTGVVVLKYLPSGRGVVGPRIPKPTFTFSESAKDKLVCFREDGETFCDEATTTTFKVSSTATMQNVDITQFDAETAFTLNLGELELERTLGDDPRYTVGKTKATFVENILDDDKRTRKALTITLSWPKGKFKVSVVSTAYFDGGILADDYLDEDTGRITDTLAAEVTLGDFVQEFDVAVTGKVTSRDTRDEEFTLSTVTLTGKGTGL